MTQLIINHNSKVLHVAPGLTEQCNTDDIKREHRLTVFYENDSLILNHWLGRGFRKCKRCKWEC